MVRATMRFTVTAYKRGTCYDVLALALLATAIKPTQEAKK